MKNLWSLDDMHAEELHLYKLDIGVLDERICFACCTLNLSLTNVYLLVLLVKYAYLRVRPSIAFYAYYTTAFELLYVITLLKFFVMFCVFPMLFG